MQLLLKLLSDTQVRPAPMDVSLKRKIALHSGSDQTAASGAKVA
jgi:hypothetical protein